ncbi:hypothetical protein TFLX_05327 [Thermoflexales bacterium]|nr:hypothetical protein TFLX_05327 [Thermoflexales bacterium]
MLVVAACGSPSEQRSSQMKALETSQFGLVVTTDKRSYEQDIPITVTTKLAVLDDGEGRVINYMNPMMDYRFILVNETGQDVPLTKWGKIAQSARISRALLVLTRDEFLQDAFQLDFIYDLSKPGTYTLTLTKDPRSFPIPGLEVTGNIVTFSRLP